MLGPPFLLIIFVNVLLEKVTELRRGIEGQGEN